MKKIFVLAYSKINVGDDLFVEILTKRYPNVMFYSRAIDKGSDIYIKNKNIEFLDKNLEQLLQDDLSDFSAIVYIGGSIFMEKAGGIERIEKLNKLILKCKNNNIPFFYISCNFGPYNTEEYKNSVENMLQNTTDTCFRDVPSYNQFKHVKTVRYSPDVVFSYERKNNTKINSIGISVINFKFRENQKQYEIQYYNMLINSIIDFIKQGKEVFLFSFCKYEGDEETIDYIINKMPKEYKDKINKVSYNGNLDEFLELFSKMEYMICSRFHAMILAYVFQQKKYVLSYSKKIDNVIEDLKICNNFFHIEQVHEKNNISLEDFEYVEFNKNIKYMAEKQFNALDQYLNN